MDQRKTVDEATKTAFHQDGAVVLRGIFTDWIERLQAGVERNIAEPSPDVRIYDGASGRHFGDYCMMRGLRIARLLRRLRWMSRGTRCEM